MYGPDAEPAALGIAAKSFSFKGIQVALPKFILADAVIIERVPGEDAGVMEIVELDADGVVADRFDLEDTDVAAAGDDGLLAGRVALDFRRRAFDPQQLRRQREAPAVVEIYFQHLFLPLEADFLGPVPGSVGFAHG